MWGTYLTMVNSIWCWWDVMTNRNPSIIESTYCNRVLFLYWWNVTQFFLDNAGNTFLSVYLLGVITGCRYNKNSYTIYLHNQHWLPMKESTRSHEIFEMELSILEYSIHCMDSNLFRHTWYSLCILSIRWVNSGNCDCLLWSLYIG